VKFIYKIALLTTLQAGFGMPLYFAIPISVAISFIDEIKLVTKQ
jgi:hypothetical protein